MTSKMILALLTAIVAIQIVCIARLMRDLRKAVNGWTHANELLAAAHSQLREDATLLELAQTQIVLSGARRALSVDEWRQAGIRH